MFLNFYAGCLKRLPINVYGGAIPNPNNAPRNPGYFK
jgi:hypothetical protein